MRAEPPPPPPRTKRNSNFGDTEVAINGVVELAEVRESRVLDRGRTMDLRAPNPMARSLLHKVDLLPLSNA